MNAFSHVPPGFRFHPTDEELVDYYLRKKIASKRIDLDIIKDVDLYKIEPWDLQELCKLGSEEQNEWYFFSHKDKKYPTGTRTNRATRAGFWKATGRDKAIYSRHSLVGMRKTLVFYKGRAPNGQKSDWIMHEYRLETNENGTSQEEGWVVCRVFKKRLPTMRKIGDYESPCWYDHDQVSFMPDIESPRTSYYHHQYPCKQELDHQLQYNINNIHNMPSDHPFLQLPQLESPKLPQSATSSIAPYAYDQRNTTTTTTTTTNNNNNNNNTSAIQSSTLMTQEDQQVQQSINTPHHHQNLNSQAVDQVTDWRVLDKFVASQLSHDPQDANYSNNATANFNVAHQHDMNMLGNESKRPQNIGEAQEYASTSTSASCQIDLWK